ncbi:MAG: tripartite tricarboxylate transporter permease [Sulfolobales archaeon]
MIDLMMIVYATILSAISSLVYIVIGILPGTDETATMAPIALALLLAGVDPLLVLSWFIAAIIAFKITDAIPVALAGIPGGVMAVPQVPDALIAREKGYADTLLRKGNSAALIASILTLVFTLAVAWLLLPVGDWLNTKDQVLGVSIPRWFWILFAGVMILALTSKNKLLALITIPLFALMIQGLRGVYGKNVVVSFFLGITVGPIMYEVFQSLNKDLRRSIARRGFKEVKLAKIDRIYLNPFKNINREELANILIWSPITSILATVMSPVGLTILIGDLLRESKKDKLEGAMLAYTTREGIKLGTYIGGTLIPLLVIGAPTGPMSAGPAGPFFQDIQGIGGKPFQYILSHYSYLDISLILIYSALVSLLITYPLIVKYSREITRYVFRRISAESLYGLFIAIALVLAYYDAGLPGIFGMLLVAVISGALARQGVSLGVLFMTLVGAPTIVALLKAVGGV